ncbi:hypothetical protein B0O99DRAFT_509533 [Bisporella sp. PMI_857]|nr:hypothetical protein B0O99DRAFT_509533 [Bisporella sp. PMI_857]
MAESLAKDGAGEGAGDGTGEGWFKGMPPPKTTVPLIEGSEVMAWFDGMDVRPGPRTWLVVDVRGVEWKGGAILGSLNAPATSFWQSRKTVFDLVDRAGVQSVVVACGNGEEKSPKCASWLRDYIDDVSRFGRRSSVKIRVLKGGIEGWVAEFEGSMMEGFVEGEWEKKKG